MSEQDLTPDQLEQLREQLASVSAADVVAEAALSLIALAYVRLGVPPSEHEPSLRDALASLRMAFAEVAAHLEAHPDDAAPAAGPEPEPEDSGILRPPSGLWVPGQD